MVPIIVLAHAATLWILEFFLYPELIVYPYLISAGFLPYKDVLDQHFPGLMHLPINFHSLGFVNPLAFKTLLILIVIVQSLLIYKISKTYLSPKTALFAVLAYALWQPFFEGNQLWLDIFLPLFTLPALWFFLKKKWWLTGLFLGIGVVYKQTLVPLVAFAGILVVFSQKTNWFKNGLIFSWGAILPSILMLWFFNTLGVLPDFWFWTVTFNLSGFASEGKLAPTIPEMLKLTFPVVSIIFVNLISSQKKFTLLITGWMLASIIGGIARFGFLHLQPALPYFAIIFAILIYELQIQRKRLILYGVVGLTVLWIGFFYSRQKNLFTTKFYDTTTQFISQEINQRTKSRDKVFLLGVHPHIYALTNTLPPGKTFVFQFPWFFNVAGHRILDTLKSDPPKVIVYDTSSVTDGQYMRDYGRFLLDYIREHYQLVNTHDSVEIYANP